MAPTFISQFLLLATLHLGTFSAASSLQHAHLHKTFHNQLTKRGPPQYSIPGWEYRGCYTDDGNSRTLYDGFTANDNMTPESCVSFCSASGYPFAGVEYGRECFCSRSIAVSASLVDDSACNFPCAGNSSQTCGAGSRINVLHDASNVASATPPATNAGPPGWGFLGCYIDSQGVRTLPYGAAVPGGFDNMTVAACTQACQKQGYKYAGTEYAGECFCGNTLSDSQLAPDGLAGCSRLCNGNITE